MNGDQGASIAHRWAHYGAVSESLGGCWQAITAGPIEAGVEPPADLAGVPLLGVWDHEPSVQEIDAVTPWDFRTICPACGIEHCDFETHSEENWAKRTQSKEDTSG